MYNLRDTLRHVWTFRILTNLHSFFHSWVSSA